MCVVLVVCISHLNMNSFFLIIARCSNKRPMEHITHLRIIHVLLSKAIYLLDQTLFGSELEIKFHFIFVRSFRNKLICSNLQRLKCWIYIYCRYEIWCNHCWKSLVNRRNPGLKGLQKYESFHSKILRDEFGCSGSRYNLYKLAMSFNYFTTISPYRKKLI